MTMITHAMLDELLEDLLDDVTPAAMAAISTPAVTGIVGGWDTVSAIRFAAEPDTFRSRNHMAAITAGMIATVTTRPMPILHTVTLVARLIGDKLTLVELGIDPPSKYT